MFALGKSVLCHAPIFPRSHNVTKGAFHGAPSSQAIMSSCFFQLFRCYHVLIVFHHAVLLSRRAAFSVYHVFKHPCYRDIVLSCSHDEENPLVYPVFMPLRYLLLTTLRAPLTVHLFLNFSCSRTLTKGSRLSVTMSSYYHVVMFSPEGHPPVRYLLLVACYVPHNS